MNKKISIFLILVLLLSVAVYPAYASTFEVVSVSETEGIIDSGIGSITLTFSEPVDFTSASALTFTKADGSAVKGGAYVKEGDSTTEAIVTFGRLDVGDYTLTVGENLKSTGGASVTSAVYNYEVTSSVAEETLKTMNFDSMSTGEKSYTEMNAAFPGTSFYSNGYSKYKIVEVDESNKELEIWSSAKNKSSGYFLTLDNPIYEGTIHIDLKVRASEGYVNRNIFTVLDGLTDTQAIKTVEIHNADTGLRKRPHGSTSDVKKAHPDKDEDGYYYLRFTMSRATTSDAWECQCVDLNSPNKDLVFIDEPTRAVSFVQKFQICELYTTYDTEVNERLWLSDMKISKNVPPQLLHTDETVSPDVDTFDVILTEDVENAYVDLLADDESVGVNSELLADKRTIRVTPANYLYAGETYTLRFGGVAISDATITAKAPSATIDGLGISGNTLNATITLNDAEDKSYLLLAVGYTSEGKISGIGETVVVDSIVTPVVIDISELSTADNFKVYLWEQDTNSMIPLTVPQEIAR